MWSINVINLVKLLPVQHEVYAVMEVPNDPHKIYSYVHMWRHVQHKVFTYMYVTLVQHKLYALM